MSPADSASASDLTVEQYAGISAAIAEGKRPSSPSGRWSGGACSVVTTSTSRRSRRSRLAGTALAVDVPRGAALPFAKKKKLGELKFGMEIPKNLPPPRAAYAPPLTLEQHASLAVELTTSPETIAETLARYRLSEEARAELDAHYREKKASSAETRAAWDRAYHSYFTWLAANRRSAR